MYRAMFLLSFETKFYTGSVQVTKIFAFLFAPNLHAWLEKIIFTKLTSMVNRNIDVDTFPVCSYVLDFISCGR